MMVKILEIVKVDYPLNQKDIILSTLYLLLQLLDILVLKEL